MRSIPDSFFKAFESRSLVDGEVCCVAWIEGAVVDQTHYLS